MRRGWTVTRDPFLEELEQRGYGLITPDSADDSAAVAYPPPNEKETAENCIAWIRQHCRLVSDTGAGLVPFDLFDYQEQTIRAFFAHRHVIILKARQLGMTELVAAYILYRLRWPYRTAILLSRGEQAAGEALNKARIAWEHLPETERIPLVDPRRTSTLVLVNGSRIVPQPTTSGAGRTFNAQFLVLDEWAHQERQEEIFAAAAPTASAGNNQIIGLSSANGVGNEFHRQWVLAQNGEGMHWLFWPWHARPGRTLEWYRAVTRNMLPHLQAQEYPQTPDEAFILSGRPRFDQEALSDIAQRTCQDPLEVIPLGTTADGRSLGECRLWERPNPAGRYVCGADVAEGLVKGDYSAAVILDWYSGVEVAELHGRWEPGDFAAHLNTVCRLYGGADGAAFLGVERNNHGHAVLLALRSMGYPRLYGHTEWDDIKGAQVQRPGWLTSTKSKPLMIDTLAQALRERRPYRNSLFVAEARTYSIDDKGRTGASGDMHDDRITAYAIAEMLRHTLPPSEQAINLEQAVGALDMPAVDYDEGGLPADWWGGEASSAGAGAFGQQELDFFSVGRNY